MQRGNKEEVIPRRAGVGDTLVDRGGRVTLREGPGASHFVSLTCLQHSGCTRRDLLDN